MSKKYYYAGQATIKRTDKEVCIILPCGYTQTFEQTYYTDAVLLKMCVRTKNEGVIKNDVYTLKYL